MHLVTLLLNCIYLLYLVSELFIAQNKMKETAVPSIIYITQLFLSGEVFPRNYFLFFLFMGHVGVID